MAGYIQGAVLRLLRVYLSPYVENLDDDQLSLGFKAGGATFTGLRLNKSLLERFGLPVEIVAGDIGHLTVRVPWNILGGSEPVKIAIEDVHILARARPPGKVDPEEDERIEQATKQQKLKSAEAVDSATSQVEEASTGKNEGYFAAMISKIVDNLQVSIKRVHIRYEDGTSTPEHPFAAGFTLSEFTAVSTDANWVEHFIADSRAQVHKLVKLGALSIYFDTDTGTLDKGAADRDGTIAALKAMLVGTPSHQYILKPVTGEARVIMNKRMSKDAPKIDAQVIFDEIGVVVDRDQYRDALCLVDVFHFYRRTHQYHRFRPPEEEWAKNPARARLKFALNAIREEVHDRHRRWTWEYIANRRDMRLKYVDIYVKKLALPENKQLGAEDGKALADMEQKLRYEDIRFFRSVARAQAKKDAATRRKLELEKKQSQAARQTWGQWLWGTGGQAADAGNSLTEEEKKEIDEIIDYDALAAAANQSAPRDFLRTRVSATLNKGSFSLRADPHGRNSDIISLVFDSFSADAVQYTESVKAKLALGGFRVYDGTMPGSLYPQIVRVKDIERKSASGGGSSRQTSLDIGGTDAALAEIGDGMEGQAQEDPFFVLEVEQNPLDGHADNAVTVKMRHLEIIYHKGYVEAVVGFFKPPESQLESISALLDAAGQTLDGIRKETRAGLEYALEQHKTVDIRVDMNAPIIIIPMDVTVKGCQALVLDAGHIAVESKLADQAQLDEIQSKRGRQYSDDDFKRLEDLMYDKFSLRLESTQLLMGPDVDVLLKAIDAKHEEGATDWHILERINMSFAVQNAIVNAPNLTRFKIAGEMPELQVNFSDRKYKTLMKFIDVSIPKFGDDEPVDGTASTAVSAQRQGAGSGQKQVNVYRPPPMEEYNFDDTRSLISHRTADDRDDDGSSVGRQDQFYDVQDDTTESQRHAMQQITFQFSFSVGKLRASLFRSTSPTSEKALADAVLEGFGLTFALRQYDMSVDLYLRNVTLAMVEHGEIRKPLLSSAASDHVEGSSASPVGDGPEDLKLVRVRYIRVQKNSPEFMTKHEGVDQSVDTELSTFKIVVAPEPILQLYDFIMTTFVPQDEAQQQQQQQQQQGARGSEPQGMAGQAQAGQADEKAVAPNVSQPPPSADKIRVRVKLTSAQVYLENDANRFALLRLPSTDVAIMLRSGTLRVGARLGDISLEDLTTEAVADPAFKKLLSIEGGDLADFSYETFDPTDEETFPGYNSSVHLRTGSLRFTFMEKTVRDLVTFAVKFGRLKAVYDAASQAAAQRAAEVTRMHYDVVISTPIIVLPREGAESPDTLVLRLGEIAAKNAYLGDPNDTSTIDAGLRGISVSSEITVDGQKYTTKMVEDVTIKAKIRQLGGTQHRGDASMADMAITAEMSDVKLALTQRQYVMVMGVLERLPRALSNLGGDGGVDSELLPQTPATSTTAIQTPTSEKSVSDLASIDSPQEHLAPELQVVGSPTSGKPSPWTSMTVDFQIAQIALEVYTVDAISAADFKKHSIAKFSLIRTKIGLKQLSDGAMEAQLSLKTMTFANTRAGKSVHRDLIPASEHEGEQIMLQYSKAGGVNGAATAIVTIDSPRFILAVDPLAALAEFALSPFQKPENGESAELTAQEEGKAEDSGDGASPATSAGPGLAFRVEIIQATVLVLADDTDAKSQSIQLSIKEVLLSRQSITALKIDQLGMSFGRMDRPNERVSFLDRLNVALSLDTRTRGAQQMSSFEVEVPDPIIFRASLADIALIGDIVNNATAAANRALSPPSKGQDGRRSSVTAGGGHDRRASTDMGGPADTNTDVASTMITSATSAGARQSSAVSKQSRRRSVEKARVLVTKEQLKAHINGVQFVLIGDIQEMPMVHLSTTGFDVTLNDWSGDMKMATSLTTSIRYFNLTNSHFEPLMDPWQFDLKVNRVSLGPDNSPLNVRLTARDRLELNLTSAFIELSITSMTMWSKEAERFKRGQATGAPFRIRNKTGLALLIWPEGTDQKRQPTGVKRLDDGADVPWRFEDKRHTRDNISAVRHNSLGIQLQNTPWEAVRGISVDRQGEQVLALRPKLDRVAHQLMCEVHLENNIKVITFRSTFNVENQTSLPIEMIVVDSHGKAAAGAMKILPGESCPLPLEAAYEKRFRLRPLRGFGFEHSWSMALHWRQLVANPIRPISCKHQTPKEPAFYFQAEAIFNAKDPSTRQYPRLNLMLRAPVEIENLLPYDLKFRIHDKNTGLSSSNFLVKGGSSPVHTVELGHLLLLSVAPEDTNLKQSEYAIINTDDPELPREDHFHLADEGDLKLMLKLHYFTFPNSGGAFKVQVYSPYIFMNKTGLPFDLAAKTWTGGQRPIAGQDLFRDDHQRATPTPFMFGYPNEDRRNRLFVRVDDSKWSKPMSFEPVSADMQLVMQSKAGDSDLYVGLSYAEGLGKYKLTKVITIAPRFLIKNDFSYDLRVRQHSTQKAMQLKAGDRIPIIELENRAPPQLSIALDEPNLRWSAPFSMSDIGRTHLVLERETPRGKRTYLVRVETHIEGSSIFLYISRETEPWPLKIKNETKLKLAFQQAEENGQSSSDYKIRELKPDETVDYTWDYPAASNKRIKLLYEGEALPALIDMMAIGVPPPIKVNHKQSRRSFALSLDIQADGASQLLVISPYNEETSVYKPARRSGPGNMRRTESTDSLATSGAFETVAVNEKLNLSFVVELEGIGISVITKKPDELLYMSLRGLRFGYSDYPDYYEVSLDCKWIQIDNQLFGGIFPIILYPTRIPTDGKELESHPSLATNVAVLKDQSHGVIFIKYATILIQAMTVEVDEDFLFAVMEFVKFKDATWKEETQDVLIEHPKDLPEPNIKDAKADLFFESLQLQPIQLELSFMRTDRVNVDEKVSTRNPFYFALNALLMTIGNINSAPFNFRALFLENSRLSATSLQERVWMHYEGQTMQQFYRIIGSADFLGNPVGLFNNISSGFSDIFYEPYQGIVMHGNKDIGLGIARGATSFAKKTVFGISDSVTKFTSSIGKGLSAATLDSDWQTKRRMTQRRNKPKHALYGVAAGASAFADSVTSAFEGVASKPMEGAEKGGAAGFAKGVGKGVIGLFTKPAVGVFDFVSASTEGIRNTTTVFDQGEIDRARLPRFIASDGVLRPFSHREALGQSWLKDLDAGAYFHESYIAHLDIPGDDTVAILSSSRILFVQLKKLRVIWHVPFSDLQSLSLESSGIALINRGGTPGPFLPIADQIGREWFFKNIAKVVVQYNKAHAQRDD